jgi:hypothetical protein
MLHKGSATKLTLSHYLHDKVAIQAALQGDQDQENFSKLDL